MMKAYLIGLIVTLYVLEEVVLNETLKLLVLYSDPPKENFWKIVLSKVTQSIGKVKLRSKLKGDRPVPPEGLNCESVMLTQNVLQFWHFQVLMSLTRGAGHSTRHSWSYRK